jgi:hypothetical protein
MKIVLAQWTGVHSERGSQHQQMCLKQMASMYSLFMPPRDVNGLLLSSQAWRRVSFHIAAPEALLLAVKKRDLPMLHSPALPMNWW